MNGYKLHFYNVKESKEIFAGYWIDKIEMIAYSNMLYQMTNGNLAGSYIQAEL